MRFISIFLLFVSIVYAAQGDFIEEVDLYARAETDETDGPFPTGFAEETDGFSFETGFAEETDLFDFETSIAETKSLSSTSTLRNNFTTSRSSRGETSSTKTENDESTSISGLAETSTTGSSNNQAGGYSTHSMMFILASLGGLLF